MTRVLDLTGEKGATRFDLLRTALLSAGDGKGERVRERIRKEARLLEALDQVSEAAPLDTDRERRALRANGGTVTIAQDDFDLLTQYVDTTPWVPRVAREAVDLQDWLSASERRD
jgi:hypothetical protein